METSIDLNGLAALLIGFAAVIGSLVSGYTAVRNTRKIRDIDHAVNGKPTGAQTMQSQISDLHNRPELATPEEIDEAALLPLVKLLVADMRERRDDSA